MGSAGPRRREVTDDKGPVPESDLRFRFLMRPRGANQVIKEKKQQCAADRYEKALDAEGVDVPAEEVGTHKPSDDRTRDSEPNGEEDPHRVAPLRLLADKLRDYSRKQTEQRPR